MAESDSVESEPGHAELHVTDKKFQLHKKCRSRLKVWKEMFVPPDNTTLAYKFQRVSAYLVKLRKKTVVQPEKRNIGQ